MKVTYTAVTQRWPRLNLAKGAGPMRRSGCATGPVNEPGAVVQLRARGGTQQQGGALRGERDHGVRHDGAGGAGGGAGGYGGLQGDGVAGAGGEGDGGLRDVGRHRDGGADYTATSGELAAR